MKEWYRSKTIWGAIAVLAASLLRLAGVEFGAAEEAALADAMSTLAGVAGGLLAIYGRVAATQPIARK